MCVVGVGEWYAMHRRNVCFAIADSTTGGTADSTAVLVGNRSGRVVGIGLQASSPITALSFFFASLIAFQ